MATKRRQKYETTAEKKATFMRPIHAKTEGQQAFINACEEGTIVLCNGPAGTGKTFIASNIALKWLIEGRVDKIIMTRPIVATEDIGYLPGDMNEKVSPYMMPLMDSIEAHIGLTKTKELIEQGKIEIIPLAYSRGRTYNRAVVLADEAQNCTPDQIKMLLTRIGYETKMIINGDARQSDLPRNVTCGLSWAIDRLRGSHPDILTLELHRHDIVRNPLIDTVLTHLEGPATISRIA